MGYAEGIRGGRRQIIANIKRHYDEMYFEPPRNIGGCEIGVCLPETTLCRYFREIKRLPTKVEDN